MQLTSNNQKDTGADCTVTATPRKEHFVTLCGGISIKARSMGAAQRGIRLRPFEIP
jgi:hypothetical protein